MLFTHSLETPWNQWRKTTGVSTTEALQGTVYSLVAIGVLTLSAHGVAVLSYKEVAGLDFLTLFFAVLAAKAFAVGFVAVMLLGMGVAAVPLWREAYTPSTRTHLIVVPSAGFVAACLLQQSGIANVAEFMQVGYDTMIEGGFRGFWEGMGVHFLVLLAPGLASLYGMIALCDAARALPTDPARKAWVGSGYLLCTIGWVMGAAIVAY